MRRFRSLLVVIAMFTTTSLAHPVGIAATATTRPPAGSGRDRDGDRIDDALETTLSSTGAGASRSVRIRTTSVAAARSFAADHGRDRARVIAGTELVAVRADAARIAALAKHPLVTLVEDDPTTSTIPLPQPRETPTTTSSGDLSQVAPTDPSASPSSFGTQRTAVEFGGLYHGQNVADMAPELIAQRDAAGLTGDGDGNPYVFTSDDVAIAVIDSGINDSVEPHAGKVLTHVDFTERGAECGALVDGSWDELDHGTHVASIAAGVDGAYSGVAPGAALVDLKVFDCRPAGQMSWVDSALGWVIEHHAAYNIRVVNMSLGASVFGDGTDSTSRLVNRLQTLGIAVTVAAGNEGPYARTIGIPGAAEFATTVGASNAGPRGEWVAGFGSRGPTADERPGIDVLAPGVGVYAQGRTNRTIKSGTSMAAPFVAGLYALLAQARPEWRPRGTACDPADASVDCADGVVDSSMADPLANAVTSTARDVLDFQQDPDSGWGFITPSAALATALGQQRPVVAAAGAGGAVLLPGDVATIAVTATQFPAAVTVVSSSPVTRGPRLRWLDSAGNESDALCGAQTSVYPGWMVATCDTSGFFAETSRQTTAWLPAGTGTRWLEITAVDRVNITVAASGDQVGRLNWGYRLRPGVAPTEGGTGGTAVLDLYFPTMLPTSLTRVADGDLAVGQTVAVPALDGAQQISVPLTAVDDSDPEGRHTGMLTLIETPISVNSRLLRLSVPINDNETSPPVSQRVLTSETRDGRTSDAMEMTSEGLEGALFLADNSTVLAPIRDSSVSQFVLPYVASPNRSWTPVALPDGMSCQVSPLGLSADGTKGLFEVFPACGHLVFADSTMRPVTWIQDLSTGTRTRVSLEPELTTGVAWGELLMRQAALSVDGSSVAFVSPATIDLPQGASTPDHYGLYVRSSGQLRRVLTIAGAASETTVIALDAQSVLLYTTSVDILPEGVRSAVVQVDLTTAAVTVVSIDASGTPLAVVGAGAISGDGGQVVYRRPNSYCGEPVDWYVRDISSATASVLTGLPEPGWEVVGISNDGATVTAKEPPCASDYSVRLPGSVVSQYNIDVSTGMATEAGGNVIGLGTRSWWWTARSRGETARALFGTWPRLATGDTNGVADAVLAPPAPAAAAMPDPPTGLSATPADAGAVRATWNASPNADRYLVFVGTATGGFEWLDVGNVTSVTLDAHQAVDNVLRVRAARRTFISSETTLNYYSTGAPQTPRVTRVLTGGCTATIVMPNGWSGPARNSVTYQMSVDGGAWQSAPTVGGLTGAEITIEGGRQYRFRASATNSNGESGWSLVTYPVLDRTCGVPVSVTVSGGGSVASTPAGISCGSTCSALFDHGTSVTLTATPDAGKRLASWSGACTGSATTCTVSAVRARTVVATFDLATMTATVSRTGPGSGTVTSSPSGIDCGTTCSAAFTIDSTVTLTPVAAAGSVFAGWTGSCTGTSTCVLSMSQARSVVADFAIRPSITTAAPVSGGVGTSVTLTGSGFTDARSVTFNGVAAPFTILSATSIVTSVPLGATTGPIRVITPAATAASGTFSVTNTRVAPAITAYSTLVARTGAPTAVTVTGTNLGGVTAATLNGVSLAPISVLSATSIRVTIPASGAATGPIRLTSAGGTSTNTNLIAVNAAPTVVAAGSAHSCARLTDGTAMCWGTNASGRLGDGTTTQRATPAKVLSAAATPLTGVVSVSAGGSHTCAVLTSGAVRCWGNNANGQLGNGTTTSSAFASTTVTGITTATQVSAGASHSCARLSNGTVRCWGLNTNSRLGDGTTTQRTTPVTVLVAAGSPLTGVVSVSAGGSHTCALLTSGGIRCWGNNVNGQLGTGTTTSLAYATTSASGLSTATQVSAGTSHTCAVLSDGTARCWGLNTNSRLGDGTTTQRAVPTAVLTGAATRLTGVASISAGSTHTCAVLTAGGMRCWGNNTNGQLGIGSTTSLAYASTAATGVTTGTQVSAGGSHTVSLSSSALLDFIVRSGGLNTTGQVGDNSTTQRTTIVLTLL